MTSADILTYSQATLLLIGAIAWIVALRKNRVHRWLDAPDRLPPWLISGSDFLLFGLLLVVFLSLGPVLAMRLFDIQVSSEPTVRDTLIQGFSFQLSGLAACLLFRVHPHGNPPPGTGFHLSAISVGVKSFIYVIPVFTALAALSYWVIEALGFDAAPQDLIESFRAAKSLGEVALLIVLAVFIAPVTEELVFRAGLFRFFQARIPTMWAMGISSILFGLLHQNAMSFLPLVMLGCVFCALFQKTGRLASSIALHALFNLNSVLVIFFGPEP